MDTLESTARDEVRCDSCGQSTLAYGIVNYGSTERGYRQLCSRCFNSEIANAAGVEGFEHASFEPVGLTDCRGEVHEFHFRTRLFAPRVSIEGFELRNGEPFGYYFQVLGDPEDNLLALFGRLIQKIRRALAVQHLKNGDYGLQIAEESVVRGRIGWDEAQNGRLPLLVIDGREIDWHRFGRLLMSYEGWQFKLTLVDKSEEV